tara:strand:- start:606 stop:2258 length:1653 start_codon:yes stop_codon:yes gene_type:complete
MKILIVNGLKYPKNLNLYDKVYVTNYLNYKILKLKIIRVKCLTSIKISNHERIKFHEQLKKSLILESNKFSKRWVYLGKDYMLWRFLNILYYRELIKKIFLKHKKIEITLTSPENKDLNLAIKSLGEKENIKIKYQSLDFSEQTSPHKYGGHYDLINSKFLSSKLIVIILANFYKLINISSGVYVKYPNLKQFKNYTKFSDFLSIGFNINSIIYKLKRFIGNKNNFEYLKKINLNEKNNFKKVYLERDKWKNLNNSEFKIVNYIFKNFISKMQNFKEIDKIYNNYLIFFKNSKIKELVLDQDNSMRSKLLIYALKKLNIKSSFYFHGYSDDEFWFGKNFKKNIYDIDKIYTWTHNSKKKLAKKFKNNVEVIFHNKFNKKKIIKKKFIINKDSKILILGSSWTNMSFSIPNDCFERTVIDTVTILNSFSISKIDVKIKPVDEYFYKNYNQAVRKIKSKLDLKFKLINDHLSENFINDYDLIITDKTTGLFEAYSSRVPVILYLGNFEESNFINYKKLKIPKNYEELKKSILNINSVKNSYYENIYKKLITN